MLPISAHLNSDGRVKDPARGVAVHDHNQILKYSGAWLCCFEALSLQILLLFPFRWHWFESPGSVLFHVFCPNHAYSV